MSNFNIFRLITKLYTDPIPQISCSCSGTPKEQYDSLKWYKDAPDPLPTLEELEAAWPNIDLDFRRKECYEAVKTKRAEIISGNVIYNTYEFQSDPDSLYKINLAASNGDLTYDWIDVNNVSRALTKSQMIELRDLCLKLTELAYNNSQSLRTAINNSTNPEEVDISVGWPTVPYSEV